MAKYTEFGIVLFISAITLSVIAEQGVKNGYHHRLPSQHSVPTNETGYCMKRVPSHQANSHQNRPDDSYNSEHDPYNTQPTHHWNNTANIRFITVIDCCDDYYRDPYTHRCERNQTHSSDQSSHCQENCFGGECIGGVCNCESGWQASEGACKPICRRPCQQNAYCFSPDVCECKWGYEQSPYGDCRPVCPRGCIDGDCVAPRVCQCRPGYNLNEASQRCEAVCEGGCTHGQCTSPGVCSCDPGYINSPRDRESCVPDCGPNNCNGGQCIAPGVCNCRPGYVKDSSTNNCVPECRNGCPINARCKAPDRCVCNPGFELDHYDNVCILTSGNHDSNSNHNQNRGGNNHGEQGYCERQCINGVCMGYNICSCNDGYTPDPRDPTRTRCIASCPAGCTNGVCSAPNFCICNPGYVKDRSTKGSQRCVPRYSY